MALSRDDIFTALKALALPGGGDLVSRDMIRALSIEGGAVRFVIEAPDAQTAQALAETRARAEEVVSALDGVVSVSVVLTAHAETPAQASGRRPPGPQIKVGRHPSKQSGPVKPSGIGRIIAVASGKGGVGKSTVSANLAVALAREGRRIGLLDADIYGPSQPRMMGVEGRVETKDGKMIEPRQAHGVTLMSIGFMAEEGKAIVWRGPMLMGALQQMITQVNWGRLDTLIVDLPPGTGDVQLTLCQRVDLSGTIIVSTPQDVALIDARKAMDMFRTLKTPIFGLIENMSVFHCPKCGYEAQIFGQGGAAAEAERWGVPFLGALPIDLETRLASDKGTPVAGMGGAMADAFGSLARRLIEGGIA
ncbi:MAG: Mrp/NBP35 family ATP-binding protein [Pseudomonadota bacterium]